MDIKNANLKFSGAFTKRKSTDSIILHHAAAVKCTVEDIHRWHLQNKSNGIPWLGIGYHYFVRKNGEVWQGRPDDVIGAHAGSKNGYNTHSIGICFEGNYEDIDTVMPVAQYNAGEALIKYLKGKYPNIRNILTHRDVSPTTDCPGKYFPAGRFKTLMAISVAKPATETAVKIELNGKIIGNGSLKNGVTSVPIRLIAENLGCKVEWDGTNKIVKITK